MVDFSSPVLSLYFVPPFSFQPFLMFTSAFNERSRSKPLCDFRLGTVVTSDYETPRTLWPANLAQDFNVSFFPLSFCSFKTTHYASQRMALRAHVRRRRSGQQPEEAFLLHKTCSVSNTLGQSLFHLQQPAHALDLPRGRVSSQTLLSTRGTLSGANNLPSWQHRTLGATNQSERQVCDLLEQIGMFLCLGCQLRDHKFRLSHGDTQQSTLACAKATGGPLAKPLPLV